MVWSHSADLAVGEFDIAVDFGDGGVDVFALGSLRSQTFGLRRLQLPQALHQILPVVQQLLQVALAFGFRETAGERKNGTSRMNSIGYTVKPRNTAPKSNGNPPITNTKP